MRLILLVFLLISFQLQAKEFVVKSPDKLIKLSFSLDNGRPTYAISKSGHPIVGRSGLGFNMNHVGHFTNNLKLVKNWRKSHKETWQQPWGQFKEITDQHNFFAVRLQQKSSPYIAYELHFKVFNDGVAFKYYWPKQKNLTYFELWDEFTQFNIAADSEAWWTPAFINNRYESIYRKDKLKDISVVHTPLTIKLGSGHLISIHEANLIDYASMAIKNFGNGILQSDLVPWADGIDVKATAPHSSSWRVIMIGDEDKDLLASTMMLNLNEKPQIADTSWIYTGKYIGIWWGMHLDIFTWGSGPKHGATTENTKRYIDFAAKHGFQGVLVEGWNIGWDGDWYSNGEHFVFSEAYRDYDIEFLTKYAKQKGVRIVGHHETGSAINNYERQLDEAFNHLNKYNMNVVKTGYVGHRLQNKEWHHGQYGVRHYTKVMKKALEHKVMMVVHEPIKPTGLRRTYPNLMSSEGARGQEYNAWASDGGNPPSHTTILPLTRMLAGPMDFTPGIFDLLLGESRPHNRVNTTLAKQLALYVVLYSPWQMAADLPENYENQPAFQFIKDVPTNWETTIPLASKIGEYTTIVRKERDGDNWYLGSITNENGRNLQVSLNFLDKGSKYKALFYSDAITASWSINPYAMEIKERIVSKDDILDLYLAPGGGAAIELIKL